MSRCEKTTEMRWGPDVRCVLEAGHDGFHDQRPLDRAGTVGGKVLMDAAGRVVATDFMPSGYRVEYPAQWYHATLQIGELDK